MLLKKFINKVKNLVEQNKDNSKIHKKDKTVYKEEIVKSDKNKKISEIKEVKKDSIHNEDKSHNESKEHKKEKIENKSIEIISEDDKYYIKDIKIKRGMSIKAIDVYTKEERVFKTHKECAKNLGIPIEYIKENLKYGYTDYIGGAIKYLSKELNLEKEYESYLDSNKKPSQILTILNNKIFTSKISKEKREEILCSDKLDPIKMHYIFECIDEEYDEYFNKYKSVIKRGGKKKVELIDTKGEVIEVFKSLDECANHLKKDKKEVVKMLKEKNTKVGRYEIRYSLRNI